ncbi:MAG: helix-turn-helix transcriptional regulator [Clostridia bacterium]|nr:helix-turn-helix transcriptional regulator [Clostridia bacterium]
MSLGENIYRLRVEKKLSQEELAGVLEVSRQSVSKWETDSSVPELDKLVKLSETFGVTLDELVLDKKPVPTVETPVMPTVPTAQEKPTSVKKTVGTILLCFAAFVWLVVALYGDVVAGLVLAIPFLSCGLICVLAAKNVGLWCAWSVYLFIELYLRFATGISWQFVFFAFAYTGGQNVQLITAWGLLLIFLTLTVVTVIRFSGTSPRMLHRDAVLSAFFWAVNLLVWFVLVLPLRSFVDWQYRLVISAFGWMRSVVTVPALVFTVRLIIDLYRRKRNDRS